MKHSGVQDQMSNFQKAGLCPGGWLNDFHPSYRPENSSVPLRTWQQSPLASSWHQYYTANDLERVKLTHASGNRPRDLSPRSGPWCACDSEPAPTRHSKAGVLPAQDLQGNKPLLVLTEAGHTTLIWQQIPKQTCNLVAAAAKALQLCPTLMAAHQAPPSLGFSRQEHWSGLPFLSPVHERKSESEIAQSCWTPSNPMDCSLPGSSIHGIFQARVLEWVAIAFSWDLVAAPLEIKHKSWKYPMSMKKRHMDIQIQEGQRTSSRINPNIILKTHYN